MSAQNDFDGFQLNLKHLRNEHLHLITRQQCKHMNEIERIKQIKITKTSEKTSRTIGTNTERITTATMSTSTDTHTYAVAVNNYNEDVDVITKNKCSSKKEWKLMRQNRHMKHIKTIIKISSE
jgi:prolyl-tRNA editing enzyme YbaK/EbsC (Cys-tRNA(Pro) deacylase)